MGTEIKTPRRLTRSSFTFARFKAFHTHTHTHITMASMTFAKKMALPSRTVRPAFAVSRSSRVVVRAAPEPEARTSAPEGNSATPPPPPPPAKKEVTFGETMAFSGSGPETINGRLAMLGFIAALGAEASSGETIFQQVGDAEPSILFAFISPEAEMLNGRAAMIGFALLLAIEAQSGSASSKFFFLKKKGIEEVSLTEMKGKPIVSFIV